MLINEKVKIKHFYRFVEFTSKLLNVGLPHERFKLIALDEFKAESKEEFKVKRLADAYLYLINNINQSLTTEIIKNAYFLLTEITLDDECVKKILEIYYQNYDESSHYLASLVHFTVLDNVKSRKIEFAFMLSNLIMYKRQRNPFIPFGFVHGKYYIAIQEKDINKLMCVFASIEASYKQFSTNINLEIAEIAHIIQKETDILKNKYQVKKMYLYGSFAKGKTCETSDLDFLIIFNECLPFERLKRQEEIKVYLSKKIGIYVDLIDFTNAIEELDIREMENIITLI